MKIFLALEAFFSQCYTLNLVFIFFAFTCKISIGDKRCGRGNFSHLPLWEPTSVSSSQNFLFALTFFPLSLSFHSHFLYTLTFFPLLLSCLHFYSYSFCGTVHLCLLSKFPVCSGHLIPPPNTTIMMVCSVPDLFDEDTRWR